MLYQSYLRQDTQTYNLSINKQETVINLKTQYCPEYLLIYPFWTTESSSYFMIHKKKLTQAGKAEMVIAAFSSFYNIVHNTSCTLGFSD